LSGFPKTEAFRRLLQSLKAAQRAAAFCQNRNFAGIGKTRRFLKRLEAAPRFTGELSLF
jgi:hypothetical protein